MSVERPATFDEVRHFEAVQRLLRECFATVKHGVLQSMRLAATGTTISRSASERLLVQPDLDVLSNDTWFARSKRKVREPDAAEMARWRLVAVTPETGGTLPIGPDGALNALVDSEPMALPQVEIAQM